MTVDAGLWGSSWACPLPSSLSSSVSSESLFGLSGQFQFLFSSSSLCYFFLELVIILRWGCLLCDMQVVLELYMSLLLLRDCFGGVCTGFDQSTNFGHEVVH
ncbi:hypothetical protein Dsin_021049 [Dipteronia sinensis]|uniref:Uncharacterized protein n=1 Tax=Dipteronia sinensis TaxID=43782 RepID=A0AAE0ABL1_9ROSI|nr:hypothetical protein Dsin_032574 [Dipteronia sinensis]KAK3207003.1 hypothetical protein Dsin_021049 [Dipteronia sinensis]